jgi:hypothetical protein
LIIFVPKQNKTKFNLIFLTLLSVRAIGACCKFPGGGSNPAPMEALIPLSLENTYEDVFSEGIKEQFPEQ